MILAQRSFSHLESQVIIPLGRSGMINARPCFLELSQKYSLHTQTTTVSISGRNGGILKKCPNSINCLTVSVKNDNFFVTFQVATKAPRPARLT
jgi:hypothetical protein